MYINRGPYSKVVHVKNSFTLISVISGLLLIKLHGKPTFCFKKLLAIFKAIIEILIPMILLVLLQFITGLIELDLNKNKRNGLAY